VMGRSCPSTSSAAKTTERVLIQSQMFVMGRRTAQGELRGIGGRCHISTDRNLSRRYHIPTDRNLTPTDCNLTSNSTQFLSLFLFLKPHVLLSTQNDSRHKRRHCIGQLRMFSPANCAFSHTRTASLLSRPGALRLPRDVPTDAGCRVQGHDKRDTCTKATDTPIDSPLTPPPTIDSPLPQHWIRCALFLIHQTTKHVRSDVIVTLLLVAMTTAGKWRHPPHPLRHKELSERHIAF
jgi:hypothetical protein